MLSLSSTDVAIAHAITAGTLVVTEEWSERFSDTYWSVCDEAGLIEVHLTRAALDERLADINARLDAE